MFRLRCSSCGFCIEKTTELSGRTCPKCGALFDETEGGIILTPGTRIGGFEIIRLIGSGGTGNVYQATQLSMGRVVAVKVLYPELTRDASSVSQFFDEVRTLGQIQHPNIVCAFESGEENGMYFLAMQYVSGLPLDEQLEQNGPVAPEKALELARQIAEALKYVWDKYRICHRDIKPGNIMVDEDGNPMLLDFGAVLRAGDDSIRDGQIEGSPCFMSPEQAHGEHLSFSSDMYSLGATLYTLMVGVPPYDDPDVNVILQKHCSDPFPMPSQRNPDVTIPAKVTDLLKKMMGKTPAERYTDWGEFLKALSLTCNAIQQPKSPKPGNSATAEKTKAPAKKKNSPEKKSQAAKNLAALQAAASMPKKGFSWISLVLYVLITGITVWVIYFMIQKKQTEGAQALLDASEENLICVAERDGNPDHAVRLFQQTAAAAKKFAVNKKAADEILSRCKEVQDWLQVISRETADVDKLHLEVKYALSNSKVCCEKCKDILTADQENMLLATEKTLNAKRETLKTMPLQRKRNAEIAVKDAEQLKAELDRVRKIMADSAAAKKKTEKPKKKKVNIADYFPEEPEEPEVRKPEEPEESNTMVKDSGKPARTPEQIAEEEHNQKIEKYTKRISRCKEKIGNCLIRKVRDQEWTEISKLLEMPADMKTRELELKDKEIELNNWYSNLRDIVREAQPVLEQLSSEDPDKRKKIRKQTNRNRQYCAFLCYGYFADAVKIKPDENEELIRLLARGFLEPRIRKALELARQRNTQMLTDLREEYVGFEFYNELENEIISKRTKRGK